MSETPTVDAQRMRRAELLLAKALHHLPQLQLQARHLLSNSIRWVASFRSGDDHWEQNLGFPKTFKPP